MKKKFTIIILIFILVASLVTAIACEQQPVTFTQREFELNSGDAVVATGSGVTFRLAKPTPNVTIDENSGVLTYNNVADCTQVVVYAVANNKVCDMAVCTLRTSNVAPQIEFTNLSDYVVSGGNVSATSTPMYSVEYSLKELDPAIQINAVSGRVTFGEHIADEHEFTVVATAKGVSAEKTFKAVVDKRILASQSVAISEFGNAVDVNFTLDFSKDPDSQTDGVLQVVNGRQPLPTDSWSYDKNSCVLTVKKSAISNLSMGETKLSAITAKNPVDLTVKVATFITTAKELASINNTKESLSGYYIMGCDIDLTEYLAPAGEGYNGGKGWTPIGKYMDLASDPTEYAFKGTFDGNGFTISGFFINRADEFAYNSGLFAYIDSKGVVKNLGLQQCAVNQHKVRSYSGGFAGVNVGHISNCWADVDVITGESFKSVGGFVGRNEGTITNCYNLGSVSGGDLVGSFVGVSETEISNGIEINCYAIQTGNYKFSSDNFDQMSCKLFASKNDMVSHGFDAFGDGWIVVDGSLPQIKSIALDYQIKGIKIVNDEQFVTRKMGSLQINVETNPVNKAELLGVTYQVVSGDGAYFDDVVNGLLHFDQMDPSSSSDIVVKATCGDFSATYTLKFFSEVSGVVIAENMEQKMYAGKYYRIEASVLPATANPQITYTLSQKVDGVTMDGDVIAISPYAQSGQFQIKATTTNDQIYATWDVTVVGSTPADTYSTVLYRSGVPQNFVIALPDGVAQTVTAVTRYDKQIPFEKSKDGIVLSSEYFEQFGSKNIDVQLHTPTLIYRAVVAMYDESQVVKIGSIQDFLSYKQAFNVVGDTSIRKKIVVLTANLDFATYFNQQITSLTAIGSSHLGTKFEGIFNGNGYTISNLVIDRNDFSGAYEEVDEETGLPTGEYKQDETKNPYHASRYNVGLFSSVSGVVTNVNFQNVTVASMYGTEPVGSFVGVVAGTLSGEVSNCTFTNCTVKPSGSEYVTGIICGKNSSATVLNCTIDGKTF